MQPAKFNALVKWQRKKGRLCTAYHSKKRMKCHLDKCLRVIEIKKVALQQENSIIYASTNVVPFCYNVTGRVRFSQCRNVQGFLHYMSYLH
jgi:hypothetical protein